MSAEIQWDIQKEIYNLLSNDNNLNAIVGSKIYDYVPSDTNFPYIVIGDMTATPFDSQIGNGLRVKLTINAFSNYKGTKEVKDIMRNIYNLLHNSGSINITGQNVILCQFISSKIMQDIKEQVRQSLQIFEIITEEII